MAASRARLSQTKNRPMTFLKLCQEADARARKNRTPDPHLEFLRGLLEPDVTLEQAYSAILARRREEHGAAAATIEALMFGLRNRGTKALKEPQVQRRVGELNDAQLI